MLRNPGSSISQVYALLQGCLKELGKSATPDNIEAAAFLIQQAMSGRSRDFHNLSHALIVARGLPPLGRLAAAYHDTVYFQVDQGVGAGVHQKIADVYSAQDGKVRVARQLDPLIQDVAHLFGFVAGQELPLFGGLNEFLSAAFAVRELSGFLTRAELLAVAAAIEATVPFRTRNARGQSAAEVLASRLAELNQGRALGLTESDLTQIVHVAVAVANSDVQNFSFPDVGEFLDNTWKLLPEVNPEFHSVGVYSLRKFRIAIMKMEGFVTTLNPANVFRSYAGVPSADNMKTLHERVTMNLAYAGQYLRAKLLSITVLEALAEITGGDAPIAYFTGAADSPEKQLHDHLPEVSNLNFAELAGHDPTVLNLLAFGRHAEVRFDTTASPVSAYLYEVLSAAGIDAQVRRAREVWGGTRDWSWFLDGLPPGVVATLAEAAAQIAIGRADRLHAIAFACRRPRAA